jgi:hypothetical protein
MSQTEGPGRSLLSALRAAGIKTDNDMFIQRLMNAVGVSGYEPKKVGEPYVSATRRDGLPNLRVYWGYTTGFTTEEEASRHAAELAVETGPSGKMRGKWYVGHPINGGLGPRPTRDRPNKLEPGKCPNRCGYQLSANGKCPNCDDD